MQVVAKVDWPKDAPRFAAGDVLQVEKTRGRHGKRLWVFRRDGKLVLVRERGKFPRKLFEKVILS